MPFPLQKTGAREEMKVASTYASRNAHRLHAPRRSRGAALRVQSLPCRPCCKECNPEHGMESWAFPSAVSRRGESPTHLNHSMEAVLNAVRIALLKSAATVQSPTVLNHLLVPANFMAWSVFAFMPTATTTLPAPIDCCLPSASV